MLAPRCTILGLASWLALAAPGCVIDDVDLSDRRCPCIAGWVCDEARDRCVLAGDLDAEVSLDAGPSDAEPAADAELADAELDAAGPADAAPADAPPDAGPLPTCDTLTDAIFCEDFEGEDLARWTITPSDGSTILPSAIAAHGGVQGLHVVAPPSATTMRMTAAIETGVAADLYFRAWVRVVGASSGPVELFELAVSGAGSISAQMLPESTRYAVRVADVGTAGVSDESRDGWWTVGEWTCVAVHVFRSDTVGSIEVLRGGGPSTAALENVDTNWDAPYDVFSIAIGSGGAEVQIDDVMWTRTPVPCL